GAAPAGGGRGRGDWSTLDGVGLFKAAGLYRKDLGAGKHSVLCPWADGHTTGSDGTDTVVFEGDTSGPAFKCLHAHCSGRGIRDVRGFFGADEIDRWCTEEWRPRERRGPAGPFGAEPAPTVGCGCRDDRADSPDVGGPENEPAPEDPTLTDTGNATRLTNLHGDRLHYVAPWRKWLVFEAGRWTVDYADVRVRELAKDVGYEVKVAATGEPDDARAKRLFAFGLQSLNARGIAGMVDLARGKKGILLDHEKLDADGWLLGVENGVVDLRTGTLRSATPPDLMTMQALARWVENATATRWECALEEWFPNRDVRAYVQRVAGAALVGAQRDHVFIIHYGGGRNGKGTFTRALQRVLGPYAVVIHLSLLVEQKHSQHDTVKAALFRARLAVASETQRRVKLDEAS
ncbi:MAG: phage/plasmid primase, P4 family, partial [Longimicrobiales bacterium]|nr:phage/plasmid primase, P4 family [Longimicrobiales bacterium]